MPDQLPLRLSLDKCPFYDVVAGFADMLRNTETERVQHRTGVVEHLGTPANHHAIVARIEGGQRQVPEQFTGFDQRRQAAAVGMWFARYRGIVVQLLADRLAQDFMLVQIFDEMLDHRGFPCPSHSMYENHVLETLVDFGILDHAHEGGRAGPGAQQI